MLRGSLPRRSHLRLGRPRRPPGQPRLSRPHHDPTRVRVRVRARPPERRRSRRLRVVARRAPRGLPHQRRPRSRARPGGPVTVPCRRRARSRPTGAPQQRSRARPRARPEADRRAGSPARAGDQPGPPAPGPHETPGSWCCLVEDNCAKAPGTSLPHGRRTGIVPTAHGMETRRDAEDEDAHRRR